MYWLILLGIAVSLLPMRAFSAYCQKKENRIHQFVQTKLAAGEKPNRLIKEQSPYLLQHAFNPVDWYPWGEEAFARARNEDKPIFLSIGYSTCHWCHVMAHESFENPEIAATLKRWFVCIKIDREERPDIDQMYMAATQAMTGSGGWPMSVFLLPDASPFYAGTYFPPTSRGKRPGFKDLLTTIHQVWLERRDDVQQSARRMVAALEADNAPTPAIVKPDVSDRCFTMLEQSYDPRDGGFGQAPKFPRPAVFSFLFTYYQATGKKKARDMAIHTLERMAAGGMHDQLGGGFHRYSVDAHWFVPHFEKMLYDQAQLANSYLDAYQITGDAGLARTAEVLFAYLLGDMRDPAGGFYSAEDADSDNPYHPGEHGEGAFFLWTKEDIEKRLGPQKAAVFNAAYGVQDNGNVREDPMGEFSGRNILHRVKTNEALAAEMRLPQEQVVETLAEAREVLEKARAQRQRPHLDDKVITAWNGMMIGALARGSTLLGKPHLLTAAEETACFIKDKLYDRKRRTLHRRYRQGESGLAGQLSDYSYLVDGLLDLYQASHRPEWLKWAVTLTELQIKLFWNEQGNFFFDSGADPSVKIRMRDRYDGAEPAGNSVAAHNLMQLGLLRSNPEWQQMARRLIESFSGTLNSYPPALPLMLTAWQQLDTKPSQVIIAGQRGAEETDALLRTAGSSYDRSRLVLLADGAENQAYLAEKLSFMATVVRLDNKATAYVCTDFTCRMPVTEPKALQLQLEEKKA